MPDQLLVVRNSELSTWRECRQKWEWGWNQRLRKREGSASALAFGSLIHRALELFYKPGKKRGGNPANIWKKKVWPEYVQGGGEDFQVIKGSSEGSEGVMAYDLGLSMMREYWKEYGSDEHYEIIVPEQTFQLDIYDENDNFLGVFTGTVDAVIRDLRTMRLGFFEHKTGKDLNPFGAPLIMDEQAGSYWTFGAMFLEHQGLIESATDLDFVLYNRLKKILPDTRPRNEDGHALNKDGTVSKRQPTPMFKREYTFRTDADRASVYDRVNMQMQEIALAKDGKFFIYKSPAKHCGFCEFRDLCEIHEGDGDWEDYIKNFMGVWDPYEDHADQLQGEDDAES